jgi:RND family efflux transporter MFP subunit
MQNRAGALIITVLLVLGMAMTGLAADAGGNQGVWAVRSTLRTATATASGQVEAVRHGTVASQVSGQITAVTVALGDTVKAGQLLLRIDAGESLQEQAAVAAAATAAEAQLQNARAEHARATRLREREYLSQAAMQRADAQLSAAVAAADATRSRLQQAQTRAGQHLVKAPYDGRISELRVAVGDLATPGRPLLVIYDPSALRVIAQLPEAAAAELDTAGPAELDLPGDEARAPVRLSSWQSVDAVDPASRSLSIRAELPGGTVLRPGQYVRLRLPLRRQVQDIRIPQVAVVTRSEVTAVYVLDGEGKAQLRQVRLGPLEGDQRVILAGLSEGERVALQPLAAAAESRSDRR